MSFIFQMKYLSQYGGNSVRETVTRIMVELLTNDLAIQYNLNGQKGKMSFGKLHLANVLFSKLV